MGGIISRPVNYVKNKVINTKTAVVTRVTNTKNAVATTYSNIKDGIVTRVDNAKNRVKTTVNNTRTGVHNFVTGIRDGIYYRVNAVKNAVTSTVRSGVNAVVGVYTGVKTRIVNTKNRISTTVQNAKDNISERYHRLRAIKLTRKQKVQYGISGLLGLVVFLFVASLMVDLYQGNTENAQYKMDLVKSGMESAGSLVLSGVNLCFDGCKYCAGHLWIGTKLGAGYLWTGTLYCTSCAWEGTKLGGAYAYAGSLVAGDYLLQGTKVTGQYLYHGTIAGAKHGWEGTKLGAQYMWEGTKIMYHYGLREGTIHFYHGAKYILTNMAVASYHGAIYLFQSCRSLLALLFTGSVEGGALFYDGSKYIVTQTSHGIVSLAQLTKMTTIVTGQYLFAGGTATVAGGIFVGSTLWEWLCATAVYSYHSIIAGGKAFYAGTKATANFIVEWGYALLINIYIGLSEYGLRWLIVVFSTLGNWLYQLGTILFLFFKTLGGYLINFIYVTFNQIYNICYILVAFVLNIIGGVMNIIRLFFSGIMHSVTFVFSSIIWVSQELFSGYMFALNKYNMYRELLFVGFIALLVLYCTGLMRDLRKGDSDEDSDDSDLEEVGLPVEEDDEDDTPPKAASPAKRQMSKGADLPPIYEKPEMPSHHDSLSDDDFELPHDQEVPSAFDSGPESEHDISFEEQHDPHNVSSDITGPSDVESDPENQSKKRPDRITLMADHQVPDPSMTKDILLGSPAKSTPSDSEDGKRSIRESCEKDAELVPEKAQSREGDDAAEVENLGTAESTTSNVDVGAVQLVDHDRNNQDRRESQRNDQCSSSSSNVNPASTI